MKKLPRTVVALGVVSLLTDASSEMIYPFLPVFLAALGAGPQFLGLVEGIAESTAAVMKLVSGRLSDRWGRRKPFIVFGYGLSGLVRPLMGIVASPLQIMGIRFADRIGKGLRSSPRDALIGGAVPQTQRGAAFGFHRAMDHAGAVVGPLLASAAFWLMDSSQSDMQAMRAVFLLAAIPAILAFLAVFFMVQENAVAPRAGLSPTKKAKLSARLKLYLVAVFILNLSLSSDAFLLLRAADLGVAAVLIPVLWSFHHVVKVVSSQPGGALSDRIGRLSTLNVGYVIYILVYVLFGMATQQWHAWALLALYGLFFGMTEGTEKALLTDMADERELGTAFGAFHLVAGLAAFPASFLFGVLWDRGGAQLAFWIDAGLALLGLLFMNLVVAKSPAAKTA